MQKSAVGIVEPKDFHIKEDLKLKSGKTLSDVSLRYETYGELNKAKTNAILVCHALTGDAHVAGRHNLDEKKPGWWDGLVGPGRALDTDKYFIICSNVLGGCTGSTGPTSINPKTGKEYALDFPVITIEDMVNAQYELVKYLGIDKLFCVIGGSMGGMQTLQWAVSYPEMMHKIVVIATAARSSPQQIAFNEVGRQSIIHDPFWNNGEYYDKENKPDTGLAVARMIAHITYLSNKSMAEKFGRDLQDKEEVSYDFSIDYQVQSYLHHQGETFVERFDANCYLYITKAVDYFDLSEDGSLIEGLKGVKASVKLISIDSDWLYPSVQTHEMLTAFQANHVDVSYTELKSPKGHDAFLLEDGQMNFIISTFLSDNAVENLMEKIPTISKTAKVKEAAEIMFNEHVTHLPVVSDEGVLIGIVTAWDLSKSILNGCIDLEDVMTKDVHYCKPSDSIDDIAGTMKKYDISCLPVVNDDLVLEGIITTDQISRLISNY